MATLPRQVQAQLDAANALLNPAAPQPQPPAEPPPPEPTPAPTPAPTPIESQSPQPPAPGPAAPSENWEHKYKVLQGLHRQQADQLRQLTGQIEQLRQQMQAPQPTPAPAPTEPPKPAADPKDVEAFGLDMVSMVQRVADQYIGGARQGIEARFAQIENTVSELKQLLTGTSQTVAATAEDQFFGKLTTAVPQWEQINVMPEFLAFLQEPDPIYGLTRYAALNDARDKFDATRAANVFKAFIDSLPKPQATPPAESPSPRSVGSPPPPVPQGKPVYTQAQVAQFYSDARRGVYRSNPQELARLEAEFNAAMAEGRIR